MHFTFGSARGRSFIHGGDSQDRPLASRFEGSRLPSVYALKILSLLVTTPTRLSDGLLDRVWGGTTYTLGDMNES